MRPLRLASIAPALALPLALSACASRPSLPASLAHPHAAAPAPRAPLAATEILPMPRCSFDRVQQVGTTPDGARRVVVCGNRVQIEDARATFARDVPLDLIDHAVTDGRVWVFTSSYGAIYRSDDFLGALHPLEVRRSDGAVVDDGLGVRQVAVAGRTTFVADSHGTLWASLDAQPLRPVDVAAMRAGRALSVALADERTGALVQEPGRLLRTTDAGATWTELALGGELPVHVERNDAGDLVLETLTGRRRLGDNAPLAPPPSPSADAEADERTTLARIAAFVAPELEFRGIRASDGAVFTLRGGTVERLTDASGDPGAVFEDVLPPEGCALASWGAALRTVCVGGDVFRSDDGRHFDPVERPPLGEEPRYSDDGLHAVTSRGCSPFDPHTFEQLCALNDGRGPWQPVRVGGLRHQLLDLRGARALLDRVGPRGTGVGLLDLDTGQVDELPFDGPAGSVRKGTLGSDGTVALLTGLPNAPDPDAASAVLWFRRGGAPRGAPLERHDMPRDAVEVAFADASRGIAATSRPDRLYRTTDGGASWQPIDVPFTNYSDDLEEDADRAVHCDDTGCDVQTPGLVLRIRGWGPLRPPGRLFAVRGHTVWRGFRATQPPRPRLFACRTATPVGAAARPPAPPSSPREAPALTMLGAGARARIDVGASDLARVVWLGRDERGAFRGASRAVPRSSFALERRNGVAVHVATRAGLLFDLCAVTAAPCVYWAAHGGGVRALSAASLAPRPRFVAGAPAPDGGAALLWTQGISHGHSETEEDEVQWLRADGTVRAARTFAWPADEAWHSYDYAGSTTRALGRMNGRVGLFAMTRPFELEFHTLDPSEPPAHATLGTPTDAPVLPCARPPARDATLLYAAYLYEFFDSGASHGEYEPLVAMRGTLDLGPQGACLASVSSMGGGGPDTPSQWLAAAAGGRMVGYEDTNDARAPVRCAAARDAPRTPRSRAHP